MRALKQSDCAAVVTARLEGARARGICYEVRNFAYRSVALQRDISSASLANPPEAGFTSVLPCWTCPDSDWPSLAAGRSPEWDWRTFSCIRFAALGKGFQFRQNGGEKFRNRRMNMHRALYNRIRRLRIHDVQQNLDYFIASDAKDRST